MKLETMLILQPELLEAVPLCTCWCLGRGQCPEPKNEFLVLPSALTLLTNGARLPVGGRAHLRVHSEDRACQFRVHQGSQQAQTPRSECHPV